MAISLVRNIVVLLTFMIFSASLTLAQENTRLQALGPIEKLMKEAREKKAEIYAPVNYARGLKYYREAEEDLKSGKELEDVKSTIEDAAVAFQKSLDASGRGEITFAPLMKARADAMRVNAQTTSPDNLKKGEALFSEAARDLEDDDAKAAKREADEAEALFREAELEAIKAQYLTPALELLKQADAAGVRSTAPKTLERAETLLHQSDELFNQNRYDTLKAPQVAAQARYEAAHALYLHSVVTKMKKDDKTPEDYLLLGEQPLQELAIALDVPARFDSNYAVTLQVMLNAVKGHDARAEKDAESRKQMEGELSYSKQQIASMERRIAALTELEKDVKKRNDILQKHEEAVAKISASFTPDEATVLKDGANVIVRLYGLVFPAGKNIIESKYFGLLSKVKEAINRFPNCQVSIEGHVEAGTTDQVAQRLSENRADAVSQYLRANLGSDTIRITSMGYGKNRPLASNDTPGGRAKNRRIEIVITPEWAGTVK